MESARQAFSQWREMPTLARGALLLKLADTLAEHREALAQLESLCSGKNYHAGAGCSSWTSRWRSCSLLRRLGGESHR